MNEFCDMVTLASMGSEMKHGIEWHCPKVPGSRYQSPIKLPIPLVGTRGYNSEL